MVSLSVQAETHSKQLKISKRVSCILNCLYGWIQYFWQHVSVYTYTHIYTQTQFTDVGGVVCLIILGAEPENRGVIKLKLSRVKQKVKQKSKFHI